MVSEVRRTGKGEGGGGVGEEREREGKREEQHDIDRDHTKRGREKQRGEAGRQGRGEVVTTFNKAVVSLAWLLCASWMVSVGPTAVLSSTTAMCACNALMFAANHKIQ